MGEELRIELVREDDQCLEARVEDPRGVVWHVSIEPRGGRIDLSSGHFVQHWEATINGWRPRAPGLTGGDRQAIWEAALQFIRRRGGPEGQQ